MSTRADDQASERTVAARRLLDLSIRALDSDADAAANARVGTLHSTHIDRSIAAHDLLDAACEDFRKTFVPRAGKVVAAHGQVFSVSPAGRRIRVVYTAGS